MKKNIRPPISETGDSKTYSSPFQSNQKMQSQPQFFNPQNQTHQNNQYQNNQYQNNQYQNNQSQNNQYQNNQYQNNQYQNNQYQNNQYQNNQYQNNQYQNQTQTQSHTQNYQNTQTSNNQQKKSIEYLSDTHKTSQRHKTPLNEYTINPKQIPRPNNNDEIYLNLEKNPIYETNINSLPPHSTSHYVVKETDNSSCRFIRSTLNYIPNTQLLLNESNLLFGICVQPFAEIPDYENEIPKVEANDVIFRCKKCNSYINNKYRITYNSSNKQVIICNLCNFENDFDMTKPGMKNEYFNNDSTLVPELNKPTIDFIAPIFKSGNTEFKPHYIFMIDIEKNSFELGFPSYIFNSIQNNLDYFHNSDETYISICLYDSKYIYFFYSEKNDIRLTIMSDLNNPFCPIPIKKLYLNIKNQRDEIEKLFNKLNTFLETKYNNETTTNVNNTFKQIPTPTGAAIKSGVDSLLENGGRVLIFTPNPCSIGFGSCISRDKFPKDLPEKRNPFIPQHNKFDDLIDKCNLSRICVDQFIFMSYQYDLSTLGKISNFTGGHIEYYNYTSNDNIFNSLFEKMHYDVTRIISRPNYYDCRIMIRLSEGIDCVEILGPFNRKLGEAFQLGCCDPDFCYYYSLRISDDLKPKSRIHIQIACLFIDNFNQRYLRLFNSTYEISDEVGKIFSFTDVDSLTKGLLLKEISLTYRTDFTNVRQNLEERIINSFKYYREKEKSGTPSGQLILPLSIRYLPLYTDSFIKKGILKQHKNENLTHINNIISLMFKFMRIPVYSILKFLYPKFYRIDDIQNNQINRLSSDKSVIKDIGLTNPQYGNIQKPYLLSLTKDNIDFDCAYLIDNGEYISIIIFNEIDSEFYQSLFGVNSFDELIESGITSLDEENENDLNQRILNIISQLRKENSGHFQPIRLLFYTNRDIFNPQLTSMLVEDQIEGESNYSDYLTKIHKQIQARLYN